MQERFVRNFTGNRLDRLQTDSRKRFDGTANTNRGGSRLSRGTSRNTTRSSIAGSDSRFVVAPGWRPLNSPTTSRSAGSDSSCLQPLRHYGREPVLPNAEEGEGQAQGRERCADEVQDQIRG